MDVTELYHYVTCVLDLSTVEFINANY